MRLSGPRSLCAPSEQLDCSVGIQLCLPGPRSLCAPSEPLDCSVGIQLYLPRHLIFCMKGKHFAEFVTFPSEFCSLPLSQPCFPLFGSGTVTPYISLCQPCFPLFSCFQSGTSLVSSLHLSLCLASLVSLFRPDTLLLWLSLHLANCTSLSSAFLWLLLPFFFRVFLFVLAIFSIHSRFMVLLYIKQMQQRTS